VDAHARRSGPPRAGRRWHPRTTALVAHIGFPTDGFVSPLIYNPYFEQAGIDAVVVPMGCRRRLSGVLRAVFTLTNIRGALVTMPHKVTTARARGRPSSVRLAGSCNAVRPRRTAPAGRPFDGKVRARAARNGCQVEGPRARRRRRRRGIGDCGLAGGGRRASIAVTDPRPGRALPSPSGWHATSRARAANGDDDPPDETRRQRDPARGRDGDPLPLDVRA
jgi:shikimate dehydrogenase